MNEILRVAKQELREISQRGFCLFYLIIMVLALIGISAFLSFLIRGVGLGGMLLEPFINILPFIYGVGLIFLYQFGIGTDIFYRAREKIAKGSIAGESFAKESVAKGSVAGENIGAKESIKAKGSKSAQKSEWLGKASALTLITYLAAIIAVCLSIPLINIFVEAPALYLPVLLGWIYLFLIFPFLCFFFIALVGKIHLSAEDLLPGNFVNLLLTVLLLIIPILLLIIGGGIFPAAEVTLIFSLATVCLASVVCLISLKE
jgi:hypothetical protein